MTPPRVSNHSQFLTKQTPNRTSSGVAPNLSSLRVKDEDFSKYNYKMFFNYVSKHNYKMFFKVLKKTFVFKCVKVLVFTFS